MADEDQQRCANCGTTGEKLLRCSRCKTVRYCSTECQAEHYPTHKGPCKAAAKAREKTIYYFKTEDDEDLWALGVCEHLFATLNSKFRLVPIVDRGAAVRVLKDPNTKIVLAVTPWVTKRKANLPLKEFLERGGALFCCGQFSNTIRPLKADEFFQKMGFPWKFGSYCRTDDQLTPAAAAKFSNMPQSYSNKATRLADVNPSDRIYAPTADSRVQSMVFAAEPVKTDQASVVLAKCFDNGYFGYIGDVNDEAESAIVVANICEWLQRSGR
jgi:MYND finger